MYHSNTERKFSSLKNLTSFNFVSKSFNCLSKTSFDLINYNQLPVIKEEEGWLSDEEDNAHCAGKLLLEPFYKKSRPKKAISPKCESEVSTGSKDQLDSAKNCTKLPPIVNVNCLMNVDLKQSHHIWDTNFGKRLIIGKHDNLSILDQIDSSSQTEDSSIRSKRSSEKSISGHSSNSASKQKSIAEQNVRNGGGDTVGALKRSNRKKLKKISKASKNIPKKFCTGKDSEKDGCTINATKSDERNGESSSKEKLNKKSSKNILNEETLGLDVCSNDFHLSKNRHFLTECVRSILDNTPAPLECEHCKEEFEKVEDLCDHRKQHESKKETCLLCGKEFYNPNEFVQHLLSHEGVDRFSCKRCRKYFPSLKKYKLHCREFHSTQKKSATACSQVTVDYVKRWLPKYECKRCKLELDSEKSLEEHKRFHIKMDLAGAYLLSSNI